MELTVRTEKEYSEAQIQRAIDIANIWLQKQGHEQIKGFNIVKNVVTKHQIIEPTKTSDHQPCGECGGIFFLRTGTCHVCQTCGASQGCS